MSNQSQEPKLPFSVVAGKLECSDDPDEQFYRNVKYADDFSTLDDALEAAKTCAGYHFIDVEYQAPDGKRYLVDLTEKVPAVACAIGASGQAAHESDMAEFGVDDVNPEDDEAGNSLLERAYAADAESAFDDPDDGPINSAPAHLLKAEDDAADAKLVAELDGTADTDEMENEENP